jgi:hypothetical protein
MTAMVVATGRLHRRRDELVDVLSIAIDGWDEERQSAGGNMGRSGSISRTVKLEGHPISARFPAQVAGSSTLKNKHQVVFDNLIQGVHELTKPLDLVPGRC